MILKNPALGGKHQTVYVEAGTGLPDRADGPAFITPAGVKHFLKKGRYHRTSGPAIEHPEYQNHPNDQYYIDGVHFDKVDFFVLDITASIEEWHARDKRPPNPNI